MIAQVISEANPQVVPSVGKPRAVPQLAIDAVLERDASGTVTAWAAALPGAVAEAPSDTDAIARLLEVVQEQLAIYREDNMPVPWDGEYETKLAIDAEVFRAYLDA